MVWPFKRKTSEEDSETDVSRKPSNSKFKQQKLPAWQPILTAYTVLPVFFFIGVVFIPVGIGLLVSSNKVKEMVIDYSDLSACKACDESALDAFKNAQSSKCNCTHIFTLDSKWQGDVYFYYGLTNFYQNHRRYVRSRDDNQLHGSLSKSVNSNCEPFDKADKNNSGTLTSYTYAPCGAIANSMFTDTFLLENKDLPLDVKFSHENIAWKSDREDKFKNPDSMKDFDNYLKPKNWVKNVSQLDLDNKHNNGFVNEDFIVWMRVAAFPTFRKLWRKLDREVKDFKDGLPSGKYELTVFYNYPVASFEGKKRFILSTASWIGGKNSFLGIAYIVVGCFCLIFGFICLAIHMKVRTKPLMD